MMMTFITQGGEGRGKTNKKRKATKSEGRGLEEGASRALMRQVGEEGWDVVGEIRTIATMCGQFHKLRWKTPRGKKVALTNGPVHTLGSRHQI